MKELISSNVFSCEEREDKSYFLMVEQNSSVNYQKAAWYLHKRTRQAYREIIKTHPKNFDYFEEEILTLPMEIQNIFYKNQKGIIRLLKKLGLTKKRNEEWLAVMFGPIYNSIDSDVSEGPDYYRNELVEAMDFNNENSDSTVEFEIKLTPKFKLPKPSTIEKELRTGDYSSFYISGEFSESILSGFAYL